VIFFALTGVAALVQRSGEEQYTMLGYSDSNKTAAFSPVTGHVSEPNSTAKNFMACQWDVTVRALRRDCATRVNAHGVTPLKAP